MTSIAPDRAGSSISEPVPARAPRRPRLAWGWLAAVLLCAGHGAAILVGMGGGSGLSGPWPLARHDHPLYFHSALVTRHFLRASGTTAGYDPSFMAGYAKSIVFPASSTILELPMAALGGSHPVQVYKWTVFLLTALSPWLVLLAARSVGGGPGAAGLTVLLWLVYVWTDFPINYVEFGMVPYFVAVPLGVLTIVAISRFLTAGGGARWLAAAFCSTLVVLAHFTTAMLVAPAAAAAYVAAVWQTRREGNRFPVSRHVGVWSIPVLVLALNAFWWLPGIWLASTKGPSDFAFVHSKESVLGRIGKIATAEAPVEMILIALALPGICAIWRRSRIAAVGLGGFALLGFFWGYLAAALAALDFLQPGRHTFAFYSAAALAGGIGLAQCWDSLKCASPWLARAAALGCLLIGIRLFGPAMVYSGQMRLAGPEPFLSSRPSPVLQWVVQNIRTHLKPGDRLLYEEGGFSIAGLPDPYRSGRFSGLLPFLTEVEIIGGPYLHASLKTNFTQFGEGKLFGRENWDRAWFDRYARLYRPAAIVCWTPWARGFCRSQPDLVEVLDTLELPGEGMILFGRVKGYAGDAIQGRAKVTVEPGRLRVEGLAAEVDGLVVLRYHSVPFLKSRPPARLEAVQLEGDPVPFLGLRPQAEPVVIEMDLPF